MPRKKNEDKKPFKETKFGKILSKAGNIGIDVVDIIADVASGDTRGAVEKVIGRVKEKAETDERAKVLLMELERDRMNFEKEMYSLEVGDRDSARNREIEVIKAGYKNLAQNALAYIGVGGFMLLVAYIVGWGLAEDTPQDQVLMVGSLLGTCGTIAIMIFTYYFGSSRGSQMKDERTNNLILKP